MFTFECVGIFNQLHRKCCLLGEFTLFGFQRGLELLGEVRVGMVEDFLGGLMFWKVWSSLISLEGSGLLIGL